jgi:cytoskeletal protein CcmA (bactofilin family)
VLIGLIAAPVYAAEPRGGDQVVIARGEVIEDDLYVTANTVTIDGTVQGDLIAIANQVVVNGTVEGDLLAVGQGVLINGAIGDDVRAGGQAIKLGPDARLGGDLVIGGLSLETQQGSAVKGDLLIGAYQALLGGQIGRTVRGGLDRMELRGVVGGDVDVALSGEASTSAV